MVIGFVGFGEVASCFARGLHETGQVSMLAYDVDIEKAKSVADSIGGFVTVVDSLQTLFTQTHNIIVAVPSRFNELCFDSIFQCKQKNLLLMDLSSSLPVMKKRIYEKAEKFYCKYVDVAVMGSVPKLLHNTPLYISGPYCNYMVELFTELGMSITIKGNCVGDASTIKLCRSVYMKGLAALILETKQVCDKFGVTEDVFYSISKNLDNQPFINYSERLINGAIKHSIRQRDEVVECLQMMESQNIVGNMTKATLSVFNKLIDDESNR